MIELFLIARKRWLWLLIGLLIGALVAMAYVALWKPNYEAGASIKIGKVHEIGLIEDINSLLDRLIDEYGPQSKSRTHRKVAYLKKASNQVKNNIVRLVAVGYFPEETRDLLARIVAKLMQRHEQIYMDATEPLRLRAATIDKQIRPLMSQITELGKMADRLKGSNLLQASAIAIERSNLYVKLNQMEFDKVILQQQTARPYSSQSEVINQVTLLDKPVVTENLIIVSSGGLLGLLLSLFAAYFKESFEKARTVIK